MNRKSTAAFFGNAIAIVAITLLAFIFLRFTEGIWWIAPPPADRWWAISGLLVAYGWFCIWIVRGHRERSRAIAESIDSQLVDQHRESMIITYASQTGFAYELAQRTADALHRIGINSTLLPIERLEMRCLERGGNVLFIASTTGEGDAPDHAILFEQQVMAMTPTLETLRYAVLALGDRKYEQFCAFGRRLNDWLKQSLATSMFDMIEVDNADAESLKQWQHRLSETMAARLEIESAEFDSWRVIDRQHLNSHSIGGSVYRVDLIPIDNAKAIWQAGDIAEILPQNFSPAIDSLLNRLNWEPEWRVFDQGRETTLRDALLHRDITNPIAMVAPDPQGLVDSLKTYAPRAYSIASTPTEQRMVLLLRKVIRVDGTPGVCSSWLCDYVSINGTVQVKIRSNPNFHLPNGCKKLILIGNGSGIAGLRGLLHSRIENGCYENWLVFGERNRSCDFHFGDDILQWHATGQLARLDLAFSRDQSHRIYVQDKLLAAASDLKQWVDAGAAIFVCGSIETMAPAVDRVIRDVMGDHLVEQMIASGRYRRDVY